MTKENETTGCLEWNGPIGKRDGTPLMKVNRKQIAVRLTLFNVQFPMLKAKKVYGNSCGNPKCVAPEHAIHRKPSKPLLEKLQNYQLFGPMDCHFPENWNGKNEYHDIWHEDRKVGAHRAINEYFNGPIPKGLVIHHICNNKPCSVQTILSIFQRKKTPSKQLRTGCSTSKNPRRRSW